MFYLKFYYKLNYIKSFWIEAKWYSRIYCNYIFKNLKEIILHVLDSISLTKIYQFVYYSVHYISAYELRLSGKAAVFTVKQYKSHHRIPANVLEEFKDM